MNVIAWIAITSRLLVQKENQEKVKELKRTLSFDSSVTILVPAIALTVSF